MMIPKTVAAAMMGALLLAGLNGQASAQTKITVSEVLRSQFYLPMYVALAKGFAKEEGLEVDVISAGGGDRAGALMLSGGAHIALAGPEVAIYIYNGESLDKPVIFSALTGTDGYFLASREKIPNFSWTMLNGKKILGTRPGSTPTLYLNSLLKKRGVNAETIGNIITNIGQQARDGAFISGIADFATFTEPALTKLEKAGRLHVIASIGKEIGRADYTVFMAKKSWLDKNPEIAQKWTNSIARAQVWMRSASAPDIAKLVSPYFPALPVEDAIATIERFRSSGAPIWSDTTEVDRDGLRKAQEMMVEGGTLPANKVVPYDAIVTNRFSQEAQRRAAN
jgi:NitT/TauT family transport system substrate-binding protein